jgi:hypothetical protein
VQLKGVPVEYAVDFIVFWQKSGEFKEKGLVRDWGIANTAVTNHGSRGMGFERLPAPPRPLDAVMSIVKDMTAPKDVVLDMFCGMATTPLACCLLDRYYLAFEIIPDTADLARRRIHSVELPLFSEPQQVRMELEGYASPD